MRLLLVVPVTEWLNMLIFSTLNCSSCDEPSFACGRSGVFSRRSVVTPHYDSAQND